MFSTEIWQKWGFEKPAVTKNEMQHLERYVMVMT